MEKEPPADRVWSSLDDGCGLCMTALDILTETRLCGARLENREVWEGRERGKQKQ